MKHWVLGMLKRQEAFLRRFEIKNRLLSSFLLISIVPLIIVAAFTFLNSYADAKDKVGVYASQITKQMQINLDLLLDDYGNLSKAITKSDIIQNDFKYAAGAKDLERFKTDDKIGKLLSSQAVSQDIDGISVMDLNGRYRMFIGNQIVPREYSQTKLLNETVHNKGKVLWLPPHLNETEGVFQTNEKVITLSTMIKDRWSANETGVIAISLKPESFKKIFAGLDILEKGEVFIVDPQGTFIYNRDKALWGEHFSDASLVTKIYGKTDEVDQPFFDYEMNGKKYLISFSRIQNNNWMVVSLIPYSYLMQKTDYILFFTICIILVFILIAIYISFSVSYSISNSINNLIRTFRIVEKGQFNIQVDQSGNDEIMRLNLMYQRMVLRLDHLINELYKTKLINKEVQITALKAQINPHFLYNTLETINSIAKIRKVKEISQMTKSLSSMFRYSIKGDQDFVTLGQEIENVKHYISILNIRHDNKVGFELNIAEELLDYKIPKLILQPLVENCVIHGIELKKEKGIIQIHAAVEENQLKLIVIDDGLGIPPDIHALLQAQLDNEEEMQDHLGKGIGLLNVKDRLKLYYNDKYHLMLESTLGEGTCITLRMPLQWN
jgi:two-component system sensor histidine kinase YesM